MAVDPAGLRDPVAMAETWAAIIGIEPPVETADGAAIAFGRRTIRFVPAGAAEPGSSPSMCAPPTGSTGPAGTASCAIP